MRWNITKGWWVRALALSALACACGGTHAGTPAEPSAPALPDIRVPCAATTHRRARARTAENAARHKRDRYPYAPGDGMAALAMYSEAADCYRRAEDDAGARRVMQARGRLRERMLADYADLQLELERAATAARRETLRRAATSLLTMLDGQQGAYVERLRGLQHMAAADREGPR